MEVPKTSPTDASSPMKGGDGRYSYANNSTVQKSGVESSKAMIQEAIAQNLDIQNLPNSKTCVSIVDMGCSVGPNTFIAIQNIIEAIDLKYKSQVLTTTTSSSPEFHVFFSDHISNDFNTLFAYLDHLELRKYLAAGVPGSFHKRLFPRGTLHLVHSSFALQYLSRVPKEVVNVNSPAWNKGRIHYGNAPIQVLEAYSAQHVKDMEAFLHARSQEIVCGGLMVLLVVAVPNGTPPSRAKHGIVLDLLGSCLMDMAEMGIVDEAKVDSFNLPVYFTSPQEVEDLIKKNGCFNVERMEEMEEVFASETVTMQTISDHMRAALEGIIEQHFGSEILDELFDCYTKKLEDSTSILKTGKAITLFVLLKRHLSDIHFTF